MKYSQKTLKTQMSFKWTQLIEECFSLANLYEICDMGWWGAGVYWIMYSRLGCVHTTKWIMNDPITGNLTGAHLSCCHLQYLQPSAGGDTDEDTDPHPPTAPTPVLYVHTADVSSVFGSLGIIIQEKQPLFAPLRPCPPDWKTPKSGIEIRIPAQCHVSVAGIWALSVQPF